mmetsp:Transcript_6873/g.12763  ORF Transcript_6873/g.12763 Transcript_6873/m.12763 type:complete len:96 (+) Transcript_6873:324-611(+)
MDSCLQRERLAKGDPNPELEVVLIACGGKSTLLRVRNKFLTFLKDEFILDKTEGFPALTPSRVSTDDLPDPIGVHPSCETMGELTNRSAPDTIIL